MSPLADNGYVQAPLDAEVAVATGTLAIVPEWTGTVVQPGIGIGQ